MARVESEIPTNLQIVGQPIKEVNYLFPLPSHLLQLIQQFSEQNNRSLKLEIEPGTFLVANAGALIATVQVIHML